MFDQIFKLISLLVSKLPNVNFQNRKLIHFGKSLIELHSLLVKLIDQAEMILNLLENYQEGKEIDRIQLLNRINEQENLINEIRTLLTENKYKEILSIQLPILFPIYVYTDKKGELSKLKVHFIFDFRPGVSEKNNHFFLESILTNPICTRNPLFDEKMRKQLQIIKNECEELRIFIKDNFDLKDLLKINRSDFT